MTATTNTDHSDFVKSGLSGERDSTDVALIVDWENLKIGLAHLKITPNVTALYEASRKYGRIVVARAYADWLEPTMTGDPPLLYRAGLEPVYVPKRKFTKQPFRSPVRP